MFPEPPRLLRQTAQQPLQTRFWLTTTVGGDVLNALDYIILIILAIPLVTGLFKGLIRMVFGLVGLIGGVVLSIVFTRPLGILIGDLLGVSDLFIGKLIAFILIFIICGSFGMLGGWLARKMIETANLGFVDRLLGGVLGLVQGGITVGFIITICYLMPVSQAWVEESMVASRVTRYTVEFGEMLPDDWSEYLSPARWVGESRSQILDVLEGPDSSDKPDKSDESDASDASETEEETESGSGENR